MQREIQTIAFTNLTQYPTESNANQATTLVGSVVLVTIDLDSAISIVPLPSVTIESTLPGHPHAETDLHGNFFLQFTAPLETSTYTISAEFLDAIFLRQPVTIEVL